MDQHRDPIEIPSTRQAATRIGDQPGRVYSLSVVMLRGIVCLLLLGETLMADRITYFVHDSRHRLVTVSDHDGWALHYRYDSSGNRTNQIVVGRPNRLADYNGDGLYDLWTLFYFGSLRVDPADDPDGDSLDNLAESEGWSDPTNPKSPPMAVAIEAVSPQDFAIRWAVRPSARYRVWWTDDLTDWSRDRSAEVTGGVFVVATTESVYRFYRVSMAD